MKKIFVILLAASCGMLMSSCTVTNETARSSSNAESVVNSIDSKNEESIQSDSSESSNEENKESTKSDELSKEDSYNKKTENSDKKKSENNSGTSEQSKENSSDESKEYSNSNDSSDSISRGNTNALEKAKSYLNYSAFSYKGLIEQLEFEGFSTEEATYGADNCGADWKEYSNSNDSSDSISRGNTNALEKAKSYLNYSAFSYKGLIEQLEFEGFSTEEATYGADNCGADWNEQAVKKAKSYLSYSSFSRSELIEQLEFEGFTAEQAAYGASQNGY